MAQTSTGAVLPHAPGSLPKFYEVFCEIKGSWHLAGKLAIINGSSIVLCDYYDDFVESLFPNGPVTPEAQVRLQNPPANVKIVAQDDVRNGMHLDRIQSMSLADGQNYQAPVAPVVPSARPSVFHYRRIGMLQPHIIEFVGGKALLDGKQLATDELAKILENVSNGVGSLRYKS